MTRALEGEKPKLTTLEENILEAVLYRANVFENELKIRKLIPVFCTRKKLSNLNSQNWSLSTKLEQGGRVLNMQQKSRPGKMRRDTVFRGASS